MEKELAQSDLPVKRKKAKKCLFYELWSLEIKLHMRGRVCRKPGERRKGVGGREAPQRLPASRLTCGQAAGTAPDN